MWLKASRAPPFRGMFSMPSMFQRNQLCKKGLRMPFANTYVASTVPPVPASRAAPIIRSHLKSHHLTIAQISDIHCGHPMFDGELLDHAINEINDLKPDLVVVAGDLTSEGYAPQFRQAKRYLDKLDDDLEMMVIPGNHDLMNVGFLHFRDSFGRSDRVIRLPFANPDGG